MPKTVESGAFLAEETRAATASAPELPTFVVEARSGGLEKMSAPTSQHMHGLDVNDITQALSDLHLSASASPNTQLKNYADTLINLRKQITDKAESKGVLARDEIVGLLTKEKQNLVNAAEALMPDHDKQNPFPLSPKEMRSFEEAMANWISDVPEPQTPFHIT